MAMVGTWATSGEHEAWAKAFTYDTTAIAHIESDGSGSIEVYRSIGGTPRLLHSYEFVAEGAANHPLYTGMSAEEARQWLEDNLDDDSIPF